MGLYGGAYTVTDERSVPFLMAKINSDATYLHNLDNGPSFFNPGRNALGKVDCVSSFPREGYDIHWGNDIICSVRSTSLLGISIKYVCSPQGWEITGRRLPTNSFSVR